MAIKRVMAKAMPVYLVELVTSEHFFEHLDAETEARAFLLECLRRLQSQGVMRLIMPDAGTYLRAHSGQWEVLAEMRPLARMAEDGATTA